MTNFLIIKTSTVFQRKKVSCHLPERLPDTQFCGSESGLIDGTFWSDSDKDFGDRAKNFSLSTARKFWYGRSDD
jgi:hypothetical protein